MNLSLTVFALLLMCAGTTWAQGEGPGFGDPVGIASDAGFNLFVVDTAPAAVLRVDPFSGDRSIVADDDVGSGVPLSRPVAIALHTGNQLVIVDQFLDAVLRVDPNTGNRQIVSGCPTSTDPCPLSLIGSGPDFANPVAIASANPTSLLVIDFGDGRRDLVQVDVATGNRTIVASPTVGSGPALIDPLGLAVNAVGEAFVVDQILDAVVGVNLLTRARSIVSGCPVSDDPCPVPVGSGPDFLDLRSIAAEANDSLVVTDAELGAVVRVDTGTGNRTIVSDSSTGQGPIWFSPVGITVESSGMILVADSGRRAVFRVDPISGNRSILSKQIRLIVSPPEGIYTSGQNFDLALIVDGIGTISDLSVMLDLNDVTAQFTSCSQEISLSDGGTALQCPNANAVFNLQPGRHLFSANLLLSVGGMSPRELSAGVIFDILATQ
jgi:hypothetical protein